VKMLRSVLALWVILAIGVASPLRAGLVPERVDSAGGITAWLVHEPAIPFIALELRFRGGTALDTPATAGAVNLMTGLLEEGAGDLDARAFATARDALAASFRFSAGGDAITVSARFLSETRDPAVDLLRLALTRPRLDLDAIERVRAQVLAGLRADARNPSRQAAQAFDLAAFGDHPYALPRTGTPESVASLDQAALRASHLGAIARDRVIVSVVGDISADELGPMLDRLLSDLPATGAPLPGPAPVLLEPGAQVIPFPGPQSVLVFGHEGLAVDDPDFFAAFVVSEVFGGGGGFSSRLMTELRERRGLTYGVGAGLANFQNAALVQGQMSTANATAAEAIEIIRAEWARMAAEGPTPEELEATKTFLTGSYPLRFDGNAAIARVLAGMQMQGYPIDYAATRNDKIMAVSLEDARRAAARLFRPEALRFVIAGAPEGLTGP
jgi:zinc protease